MNYLNLMSGLLDFLLASTSSLYLCCHVTLSLSLRWCDVCNSSSVVGKGACFASFCNQLHLDSDCSLFRFIYIYVYVVEATSNDGWAR